MDISLELIYMPMQLYLRLYHLVYDNQINVTLSFS